MSEVHETVHVRTKHILFVTIFPDVAQNSPMICGVFHVQGNPQYSGNSRLLWPPWTGSCKNTFSSVNTKTDGTTYWQCGHRDSPEYGNSSSELYTWAIQTRGNTDDGASEAEGHRVTFAHVHHTIKQLVRCQWIRYWVGLSIERLKQYTALQHLAARHSQFITALASYNICYQSSLQFISTWHDDWMRALMQHREPDHIPDHIRFPDCSLIFTDIQFTSYCHQVCRYPQIDICRYPDSCFQYIPGYGSATNNEFLPIYTK